MKKGTKIALVCALGAAFGVMVGIAISPMTWWCLLGIPIGAAALYLGWDIRAVGRAIMSAWHAVIGWEPDEELWKQGVRLLFWKNVAILSGIASFGVLVFLLGCLCMPLFGTTLSSVWTATYVIAGIAWSLVWCSSWDWIVKEKDPELKAEWMKHQADDYFHKVIRFSPPVVITAIVFWLGVGLKRLCLWLVNYGFEILVKRPVRKLFQFFAHVFKLIHTYERVIVTVDGTLGAGLGLFAFRYMLGSSWGMSMSALTGIAVGAILGGAWGYLNYYIFKVRLGWAYVPESKK
jgi:hypothetical protein